ALTGFPLTAGYFSKDAIIEAAFATKNSVAIYAFACTAAAAALTSFYSWRLILVTFHGHPHDRSHYDHARESPMVVLIPLAALAPDGVSARVLDVTRNVVRLQTGYLSYYAFAMLIGVAALITWFIFRFGGAG